MHDHGTCKWARRQWESGKKVRRHQWEPGWHIVRQDAWNGAVPLKTRGVWPFGGDQGLLMVHPDHAIPWRPSLGDEAASDWHVVADERSGMARLLAKLDEVEPTMPRPRLVYLTCCAIVNHALDMRNTAEEMQAAVAEWGWTVPDDRMDQFKSDVDVGIMFISNILEFNGFEWRNPL